MTEPLRHAMAGITAHTSALHASPAHGPRMSGASAQGVAAGPQRLKNRLRRKSRPVSSDSAKAAGSGWGLWAILVSVLLAAAIAGYFVWSTMHGGRSAALACREIGKSGLEHAVVCPTGLSADDLATAGNNACDEPLGTPCMTYIWLDGPTAPSRLPLSKAQAAAVFAVWSNWAGELRNCLKERC